VKLAHKFLGSILIISATSSCFDPPVFPETPTIEFESLEFVEFGGFSDPDSLILKIRFKDGDGDLGIGTIVTPGGDFITNVDDPFHDTNFYLSEGGELEKEVGTVTFYTDTLQNGRAEFVPLQVISRRNNSGKLITYRNYANYTKLPTFDNTLIECFDFTVRDLFIFIGNLNQGNQNDQYDLRNYYGFSGDAQIVDERYPIKDTIVDAFRNQFLHLKDTFYFQINPNHYNIEVDFFVKEFANGNDNDFREYNWRKEFCTTYDGRFPQLSDSSTPLDGILTYNMTSTGFKTIFGSKSIKLKISIKDRKLNMSNEIFTNEIPLN
jgi:hypothetical protein